VSIDGGKSASVLKSKGGKLLAGLQSRSFTQGIYYGTFFQDNLSLSDQLIVNVFFVPCLFGRYHDGVWNLFEEIGSTAIIGNFRLVSSQRESVQSWWVTQRLKAAETFLKVS